MKKGYFFLCFVLVLSGTAWSQNSPGPGGSPAQETGNPLVVFPFFNNASEVNAYLTTVDGGLVDLRVQGSDTCLRGDRVFHLGIGLPGPDLESDVTEGQAFGCSCDGTGLYDVDFTLTGTSTAIVLLRYVAGTQVFPAATELRLDARSGVLNLTQIRGIDACTRP